MSGAANHKKNLISLSLAWTICVASLLALGVSSHFRQADELARHATESFFRQVVITRAWNAKHGGVYLFTSQALAPNPYLEVEDRDLTMPDGRMLTKVNPAFMTRLIAEMARDEYDVRFHITSLNPLRPGNAPDAWEEAALSSFSGATDKRFERITQSDEALYRYIAPLMVTESCLSCHAKQGYQLGDIRGGISVTLQSAPYISAAYNQSIQSIISYASIWMIGILGITFYSNKIYSYEKKLQNKIHFLQSLIDSLPIPVFFKDTKGVYIGCNVSFQRFLSKQREAILGKTDFDIAPLNLACFYGEQDQELLSSGDPQIYESSFSTQASGYRQVIFSKAVFREEEGSIAGIVGGIIDVTEERRLKEQLEKTASELRIIFTHASVPIVYLSGERTFVRSNARFTEISGYEEHEVLGLTSRFFFITDDEYKYFTTSSLPVLESGGIYTGEYRILVKDGGVIWCNLLGKAVDKINMEKGSIWIIEDITQRKELDRIREDVNRIMLHDLKIPLSGLISLPSLMIDDQNLTAEQRKILNMIHDSGKRLLKKINSTADLLRMEMGTYVYKPSKVDINSVFRQVENDMSSHLGSKNINLLIIINDKKISKYASYTITCDESLIYTAISNLTRNAIEASNADSLVTISLTSVPDAVYIDIHNSTPVPVAIRECFFDKYATFGKAQGSGIGTYSAKLMIVAMNGTISMRTSVQEGTTVSICIPSMC